MCVCVFRERNKTELNTFEKEMNHQSRHEKIKKGRKIQWRKRNDEGGG